MEGGEGEQAAPPAVTAVATGGGGDTMTLNFSINLGNNGGGGAGGNAAGGDQTVQVSVSLSRPSSMKQLVPDAAAPPQSSSAAQQMLQSEGDYQQENGEEEVWPTDGSTFEETAPPQQGGDEYASYQEGAAAGYGAYDQQQVYGDASAMAYGAEGQASEYEEGGVGSGGEYDASGQAYGAPSQDPYAAAEEGYLQQQQQPQQNSSYGASYQGAAGAAYGGDGGQQQKQPEYKRKGLTIATGPSGKDAARVYIAPPDALSPTTYDYNKDMWGDMWSYDAQNPGTTQNNVAMEAAAGDESDDEYYEEEHLGDDFEDTPWVPPSVDKAIEYRSKVVFEQASAPVCKGVHLSDLGLGITLYFRFLRVLIVLFTVLCLLSIPALSLYSSGTRIAADKRDFLGFYALTMGNIGVEKEDGSGYQAFLGSSAVSMGSAGSVLGTMDLFCSVAYLLMVLAMTWEVRRRTKKGAALTAKDFAVYVTGFPRDAKKEAIIEHFSSLYPINDFDWKGRPPVMGRLREAVWDTTNSGDDRYMGKWVAEVTLARRNGVKLRTYLNNDQKTVMLRRIRAYMKMYSENTPLLNGKGANEDKYDTYEKQLNELGAEMEGIAERLAKDKRLSKVEKDCVGAFLIFEYVESKRRCLQDYSWTNVNQWCRYPKPMLFQNRRLTVQPAPDPEDVWWENLEVSSAERFCRRTIANIIMAIFLIVSFGVVISLTGAKQRLTANAPKLSLCDKEIPALFLRGYGNSTTGLKMLNPSPYDCANCDTSCGELWTNAGYAVYSFKNNALKPAVRYDISACTTTSGTSGACPDPTRAVQCPCVRPNGQDVCRTLSCTTYTEGHRCLEFKSLTIAGCYCSSKLDTLVAESGYFSGLISLLSDSLCSSFATSIGLSMLLQVILSVSTLAVNFVLTHVTNRLGALEHNASSDTEASQLITKVFVAMYLNTAILLLLAYGRLQGSGAIIKAVRRVGILAGQYGDFTTNWYADVGVQLCVTSLIAAISPHIEPLVSYLILQPLKRYLARSNAARGRPTCVMQADLNQLYVGPRFDVTQRYPQILTILFFAMTFSTGLPLMLVFALISFTLSYIVDRFLLLRFYRRPPQRDERLQRTVNRMLPYALFIHLGIAVWMLGSSEFFGQDATSNSLAAEVKAGTTGSSLSASNAVLASKIGRSFVFPLFLFWVFLLTYLIIVDVLPSQALSQAVTTIKSLAKGALLQHGSSDASLLNNGYTKVYERELPKDFKPDDVNPDGGKLAGWATFTYDDGSTVLRKLKGGAPGTTKHANGGKSPVAADAASPSGRTGFRKTWEIIKVNAVHSYAMSRNPKYAGAVMTFLKEFGADQQKKKEEEEGKKKQKNKGDQKDKKKKGGKEEDDEDEEEEEEGEEEEEEDEEDDEK